MTSESNSVRICGSRSILPQIEVSLEDEQPTVIDRGLRHGLYALILGRVKNAAVADDLTQEALLRIHRHKDSLRNSEKLNAWVSRIARNVIADHYRSSKPSEEFDESAPEMPAAAESASFLSVDDAQRREELASYLRSVVGQLPEKYRQAIVLTEFEDLSQVEMAKRLGISVTAAKSRTQRAREIVKEIIERCCRWETDRYGSVVDVHRRPASNCACDPQDKS